MTTEPIAGDRVFQCSNRNGLCFINVATYVSRNHAWRTFRNEETGEWKENGIYHWYKSPEVALSNFIDKCIAIDRGKHEEWFRCMLHASHLLYTRLTKKAKGDDSTNRE